MELSLYKFEYEYNEDKLLNEAKGSDYVPFTDVGNQSNKNFNEWLVKHIDMKGKVIDFYKKQGNRIEVKEAWDCPYASSIQKYFEDLLSFDISSRFYLQKKGFNLPLHKDRGTFCSINMVLGDDYDPIRLESDGVPTIKYYKTALLNTQSLHGVNATKDRYLFKMSFKDNSFEEVRDKLHNSLNTNKD